MNILHAIFALFFLLVQHAPSTTSTRLENDFMSRNGDQPVSEPRRWQQVRNWYKKGGPATGEKKVKKFCVGAHKVGLNETKVVESVSLDTHTLKFFDPKYKPMQIDVVKYGIDLEGKDPETTKKYWWMTEGHKSDCVYYLVPCNAAKTEFSLLEYVCNIKY